MGRHQCCWLNFWNSRNFAVHVIGFTQLVKGTARAPQSRLLGLRIELSQACIKIVPIFVPRPQELVKTHFITRRDSRIGERQNAPWQLPVLVMRTFAFLEGERSHCGFASRGNRAKARIDCDERRLVLQQSIGARQKGELKGLRILRVYRECLSDWF